MLTAQWFTSSGSWSRDFGKNAWLGLLYLVQCSSILVSNNPSVRRNTDGFGKLGLVEVSSVGILWQNKTVFY